MSERVVVCLSGGVDSTVAAALLVDGGHDVAGLTFWFWSFPGGPGGDGATKCCSLDAAALAAREVGIPHETLDASSAFRRLVLDDYVARYRRGETPNPCGRCNRHLRFGLALDYAARHGFDTIATGHHVRRVREPDGTLSLCRGADPAKDQTYFLYGLKRDDLERIHFPVGELTKEEVFEIAKDRGLTAAERPESQDLCFAVSGRATYLFDREDLRPGPILDPGGHRLGTHNGLPNYTIGQRRGLGVVADRPLYVIDIDPERNVLVVGEEDRLFRRDLHAVDASYLSDAPPADGTHLDVKIRYRSPAVGATFRAIGGDRFEVHFDEPQRAITPGQLAVLYDGDRLLGGGTIS